MKKLSELSISSAPWSLESYATTDTHYVIDYLDQKVGVFCKGKKSKANARLIATAPSMYSEQYNDCLALRTIVNKLRKGGRIMNISGTLKKMADRMEATLAEASGESEANK